MASPAQIREVLPETLPQDFVEWDEALLSAQPVQSGSGEAGPGVGVVSNPATQAAEAHRAGASSGNLPRGAALSVLALEKTGGAAAPNPAQSLSPALLSSRDIVVQPQAAVPAIDELRLSAPRPNGAAAAAPMTEFHEILFPSLWTNAVETAKPAKKKWPIIACACAALVVILGAAMIPVFNRAKVPSAKPAAAPAPAMTTIQQPEAKAPTREQHLTQTAPVPTSTPAATRLRRDAESVQEAAQQPVQKNAELSRQQVQMMDDQLHRPTQLHMKATRAEQAPLPPGGIAVADIGGSDNGKAIGAIFGTPKQSRVQIASRQIVNLPSSVAAGLLIEKTKPIYPSIAKAGQVSGTIVLTATVSTTGNVEKLRVVSGPIILRTSAVNAVHTWRFKPYMVDNQPTAFETTINVHFCAQQDPCLRDRE